MKTVNLSIAPETADRVPDGWQYARQRDFRGGESLAKLPEMVGRNQLVRMENAILSPEGEITEAWQVDTPLFVNVTGGLIVVPIPGSRLMTAYFASGNNVKSFTFDPESTTSYDLNAASGYPGYAVYNHLNPVTVFGLSHGVPFLGKNYCCAVTNLYIAGQLTAAPAAVDFGTVQTLTGTWSNAVTITNTTANPVTLTGVTITGDGSASFGSSASFPQTLAAGGTYTFQVLYYPIMPASSAATLSLATSTGTLQIPLYGVAESMLTIAPASYDFGTVLMNLHAHPNHTFTITNSGTVAGSVQSINFSGDGASMFSNTPASPYEATIPAGGGLDLAIMFGPNQAGDYAVTCTIVTDLGTLTVSLTGSGI